MAVTLASDVEQNDRLQLIDQCAARAMLERALVLLDRGDQRLLRHAGREVVRQVIFVLHVRQGVLLLHQEVDEGGLGRVKKGVGLMVGGY